MSFAGQCAEIVQPSSEPTRSLAIPTITVRWPTRWGDDAP